VGNPYFKITDNSWNRNYTKTIFSPSNKYLSYRLLKCDQKVVQSDLRGESQKRHTHTHKRDFPKSRLPCLLFQSKM